MYNSTMKIIRTTYFNIEENEHYSFKQLAIDLYTNEYVETWVSRWNSTYDKEIRTPIKGE